MSWPARKDVAVKTIYLLRHAKSSWDDPGLADFDRPLDERGRKAARLIRAHLQAAGIRPDLVLCSAARRTRETLERLGEALAGLPTSIEPGLYETTSPRLLERLRALPDAVGSVMVIGHNPGLERLAATLAGDGGEARALERLQAKYPTGALATLTAEAARWSELAAGACRLEAFVRPADLARMPLDR